MRWSVATLIAAAAIGCGSDSDPLPTAPLLAAGGTAADRPWNFDVIETTLGGRLSVGHAINGRGWVGGYSNETGNATRQAVVWRDGVIEELGSLGGPSSSIVWTGLSTAGIAVGIAETADLDPRGESWSCTPFFATGEESGHVCRGFWWDGAEMHALPTFGGTHGYAAGVNARGQVVGWAENLVEDPTCNPEGDQVLQFRAALWEPKAGTMRELAPWTGDSTSAATAINSAGQAVGISGDCDVAVGSYSARRGVLWEADGSVTLIGGLGGEAWHTPTSINDSGDVVGFSNPAEVPGNTFQPKAFIWTRAGGIDSLPTLEGDVWAQAFAINGRGQVVGRSCGAVCRAVLWEDRMPIDLNTRRPEGFTHHLAAARDINESGEITGNLVETGTGRNLPYVARR